jgi:hypothetical protein
MDKEQREHDEDNLEGYMCALLRPIVNIQKEDIL